MKRHLAGDNTGPRRKIVVQPCFRSFDTIRVSTGLHLSLFLMGASLYFDTDSAEAPLGDLLRFLVEEMQLDATRLWLTVFGGGTITGRVIPEDTDSQVLWASSKMLSSNIVRLESPAGFWHEGTNSGEQSSGICGPHAEIFIDRFARAPMSHTGCGPECGCGRYVELANLIYPRYIQTERGLEISGSQLAEVALGLDRLNMVIEDVKEVYLSSHLKPLLSSMHTGRFSSLDKADVLCVLDPLRAACGLIAEGGVPSGKGRGHVLRRLLREAFVILRRNNLDPVNDSCHIVDVILDHSECLPFIDLLDSAEQIRRIVATESDLFVRVPTWRSS